MREKTSYSSHVVIIVLAAIVLLMCVTVCASALTVPAITLDSPNLTVKDKAQAVITGTVSTANGQKVVLLAGDGTTILSEVSTENTGETASFKFSVPESRVKRPGTTKLYVKSLQAEGVAASSPAAVTIKAMKSQTITAPGSVTLTNLKTSATLKARASSGLALTYSSSAPKVVSVSSSGKLTRKKNGKATITITQKGNGTYLAAKKKVTVTSRKSTRKEQINAAVAWAVRIAKDNSFTYGSGNGAHHNGCYFCGTNYGPKKYMKPSKKYKKTYCCNPFVHAAYAHGAQNPKMLEGCRRANGIGMEKSTFYKFKCWKCVGKPAYKKLQKGDVLVRSDHVAMYVGGGKLAEASGGGWTAGSIAVKKMSKSRYNGFSYVMRYTGY